ncbi:twitching motility protein PilT [Picosynechococcus sp. PCC 7003]|uniref:type II toxin-antitoxin system VapC family toxin n=1 Tax=Picosynechococcus sp. PCC 7003 TaxID=374981 RepID=UPI000810F30D|nr:type II toxin-antitoxin system VapC family toxin [Picosynechococcus sp. PCC 7003]ANV83712.1 twitching motility protein PilT [Picosynechococcus sp. PCC 7003]
MKLILDTHAFLWFINGSDRLSPTARELIEDPNNQRYLSIASLWELSIKVSINKLKLGMSLIDLVEREVKGNDMEVFQINPHHLEKLSQLSFYHKDPFDRLIIAQSLVEDIAIITQDFQFIQYSVRILW